MIKFWLAIFALSFVLNANGQSKSLRVEFDYLDTTQTIHIDVLKFYISEISIHFKDGKENANFNDYWLIDFDSDETRSIELEGVSKENVSSIEFTLGTDSLTNVSGAFDGALDPIHGMYWAWNSGYINTKIEGSLQIENRTAAPFEFHLGGYSGEFKTARRVKISCDSDGGEGIMLFIDLNYFMDFIDISKTNRVMSPGKKAALLSTLFSESFVGY